MTENERYCVRAGYWHNYTGIGRCEDENLTTNEVCDLINQLNYENEQLKEDVERCRNNFSVLDEVKCEIAEENEQLKHDATVLIQANQDYRKENEKLKQLLLQFYTEDEINAELI